MLLSDVQSFGQTFTPEYEQDSMKTYILARMPMKDQSEKSHKALNNPSHTEDQLIL